MSYWHNKSGKPLSALTWLLAHHLAKLPERRKFCQSIVSGNPSKVVDLGCGPGLWLDLMNEYAPPNCSFVGIDIDKDLINEAIKRSKSWSRPSTFILCDIESEANAIPNADLFLAFNVFSYIENTSDFINSLAKKLNKGGSIAIRQYDGSAIRFGPLDSKLRLDIDSSLFTSVGESNQFKHFDLDKVYEAIQSSEFENKKIEFEIFQRSYPYPPEFVEYYVNTIQWTADYISEYLASKLMQWFNQQTLISREKPSYFYEVDLTAILS